MTGPDHYREAERLIEGATRPWLQGGPATDVAATSILTMAQVHATLALAAATAATIPVSHASGADNREIVEEWQQAGAR